MTSTETLTERERELITRVIEEVVKAPYAELGQILAHARRRGGVPVTEREIHLARDAMMRTRVELARARPLEVGDRVRVTGLGNTAGEPDPDGHVRPRLGSRVRVGAVGVVTRLSSSSSGYIDVSLEIPTSSGGYRRLDQIVSPRDLERICSDTCCS